MSTKQQTPNGHDGAAHTHIPDVHAQKNVSYHGRTSCRPMSHQAASNDERESACQYCGQSLAPRVSVRNAREETTLQSSVEMVDLESLEGRLYMQSIVLAR